MQSSVSKGKRSVQIASGHLGTLAIAAYIRPVSRRCRRLNPCQQLTLPTTLLSTLIEDSALRHTQPPNAGSLSRHPIVPQHSIIFFPASERCDRESFPALQHGMMPSTTSTQLSPRRPTFGAVLCHQYSHGSSKESARTATEPYNAFR